MTRDRIYGSDTDFCAWMRACKDLPSSGSDFGFSAHDNDITVHRYKTVVDRVGTREIQGIMQIEVKTRKGKPANSQVDTLSKLNLFKGQKTVSRQTIRFFGVFVLSMDGTSPTNSASMQWGSMKESRVLNNSSQYHWKAITINKLIDILRFDIDPYNFAREPFRRHHNREEIIIERKSDLGFVYEEKLIRES